MALEWKKGRGKLGPIAPLLGRWKAETLAPMGPVACVRDYQKFGETYVRLEAEWIFNGKGAMKNYRELAMFGPDDDGTLSYWSYTVDGKKSFGRLSEAKDVHPNAICFEAEMKAGLARQVFWPDAIAGMRWAVESRAKKGWNRFTEHLYRPA